MKSLKNLLLNELADMYDSEHRIVTAVPKMIKAATCEKLQLALQRHLEETEKQSLQIEKVFEALDEPPRAKKCTAMVGILDESTRVVTENRHLPSINAAIIAACQKVEHFEIASYGALKAWAQLLDNDEAASLLDEILNQEKEANHTLNELAIFKNKETLHEIAIGAAVST